MGIELFWERLSEKVHAIIPEGIVGGFEFIVLQRHLREWHERLIDVCLRMLKESDKSCFDSYSVRNSELIVSHITFRDYREHIFSDNLSRNSCMYDLVWVNLRSGWECMRTAKIGPDLRLIGLGKDFFPKSLVIFFQHYTTWKICFQCRIFFFARNFLASPQKWNGRPLRTTTLEKRLFSH